MKTQTIIIIIVLVVEAGHLAWLAYLAYVTYKAKQEGNAIAAGLQSAINNAGS